MIIHVALSCRIYVKVIFVSLLFCFTNSIIDLKKKNGKNEEEKYHIVGTVPISNRNITERATKNIYP